MQSINALLFATFATLTPAVAQTHDDNLLVFVGQKISLTPDPWTEKDLPVDTIIFNGTTTYNRSIPFNRRYKAVYRIKKRVQGSYRKRKIEFTVLDHYGEPAFSKYKTVLLFVSQHKGQLYHEKYQYFALYPTKDGRWASPYATTDYTHPYKADITVKPELIRFKKEVSFSVDQLTPEQITARYPAPYYDVKNGRAIAVYGNYAEDLCTLKRQTVLKARGLY